MIIGINIDGTDTLDAYGMMLCDDLRIASPEPRLTYIEIPGADGALDLSDALTGGVSYQMREITFSLFAAHDIIAGTRTPATEAHFSEIRRRMYLDLHGKKVKLWTPDDPDHYYLGRIRLGEKAGYNSGMLEVSMEAQPWHYKNSVTTKRVSVNASDILFQNEQMPTQPTFTVATGGARIVYKGRTYNLLAGDNIFPAVILTAGENRISFASVSDPITITWQEASL